MIVLCGGVAFADDVASALGGARDAHRVAVEAAEEKLLEAVDVALRKVAAKGDLAGAKALTAEKKAFLAHAGPIASAAVTPAIRNYLAALRAADSKLLGAFDAAIKAHTRKLELDTATAVQEEKRAFEAAVAGGRGTDSLLKQAALVWSFDRSAVTVLDGNRIVKDLSPAKNHGVLQGHRGITRSGNGAVAFKAGSGTLTSMGDVGIVGDQPRTFALWILNQVPESVRMDPMFGWGVSKTDRQFRWGHWGSKYRLWTYGDRSTRTLLGTIRRWEHLALTYDGSTVRTYRNGVADARATHQLKLNTGDSRLELNAGFVGGLDEVVILRRALEAKEVERLYRLSRGGLSRSVGRPGAQPVESREAHRRQPWPPQIDDETKPGS